MIAWFIGQGLTIDNYQFFLSLRFPKVLAIILAAIAIATSSLVFQTITNNRILTPSILGFDNLYVLIQVGPVLFLGLIVVSLTRELFNSYQHRTLILASSLLAVLLLIAGQWFVENVLTFQTTISVLINLAGGSYFLFLLMRNRIN